MGKKGGLKSQEVKRRQKNERLKDELLLDDNPQALGINPVTPPFDRYKKDWSDKVAIRQAESNNLTPRIPMKDKD